MEARYRESFAWRPLRMRSNLSCPKLTATNRNACQWFMNGNEHLLLHVIGQQFGRKSGHTVGDSKLVELLLP